MGFSAGKLGIGARVANVVLLVLLASSIPLGCSSTEQEPASPDSAAALAPLRCEEDEVREFQCEALLPVGPALSAPQPFDNCPVAMDIGFSAFPTDAKLARFDPGYTRYIRRRSSPGHNCCYSWCSRVEVADPADADAALCQRPLAFVERYCMTELEAGTSGSVSAPPLDRCPAAIVPPASAAFSVPPAAPLDWRATSARRAQQRPECCYSWCSLAPPGTGLEKRR